MAKSMLIIDPQNDFCDPRGALYVPGAFEDSKRLSSVLDRYIDNFDSIHVTLDTHYSYHIAHPVFWLDSEGRHPDPFTIITADDVRNGKYRPSVSDLDAYALRYVENLSSGGKYALCVWPPHCLIGSWGHALSGDLHSALVRWEHRIPGRAVHFIQKGSNSLTEHYSAIRAEVSIPGNKDTDANEGLITALKGMDSILIAGEALSHCVANTVRDLIQYIDPCKLTVCIDLCSNVKGFEHLGTAFRDEASRLGVRFLTSDACFS